MAACYGSGVSVRTCRGLRNLRASPHLLDIIERADLGPEDMDHDIAGIHNNPVGLGEAFNAHVFLAACFKAFSEFDGEGADMPGRGPGGDDHVVGYAGLVIEVDGNNIKGLVCVQGLFDEGLHFLRGFKSAGFCAQNALVSFQG